jgi:hypothetical protein
MEQCEKMVWKEKQAGAGAGRRRRSAHPTECDE